jgi:hypothetical protein
MSDTERHRAAIALLLASEALAKLARSRKYAGPQNKELRATLRSNAAAYRELASKFKKAVASPEPHEYPHYDFTFTHRTRP